MKVYNDKWDNLWKQTKYAGSKVRKIKSIKDLELYLDMKGTLHPAVGHGKEEFDKEELKKASFTVLKSLLLAGVVYVASDSWLR